MQSQSWKNLLFAILLTSSSANMYCIKLDAAWAVNSDKLSPQNQLTSKTKSLESKQGHQAVHKDEQKVFNEELITQSNPTSPATPEAEPVPASSQPLNPEPNFDGLKESPRDTQPTNEVPQLETQPSDFPQSSPKPIEQILDKPQIDYTERLERLRRRLQEKKQPIPESSSLPELGLRVRQRPLPQQPLEQLPPQTEQPVAQLKPIGFLRARIGYFHTDNIFSSDDFPIEDSLIFYGLSLASAYFPLGDKTYLNGAIDGNLFRYIDQSEYNYNQVRFRLGISHQLSPQMYGEIGWSNQQLFYARNSDRFQAGDRFLGENSLRLSLGRRDPLTKKLALDSYYEFSVNFSEPNNRSRIINYLWVGLSYELQKPLQVGLNYQLNFSDFTQRQRDDNYHRLYGHLNYRVSDSSNLNVQSGISFGDSTNSNIDFDGWFFSVNYNLQLGQF